MCARAYISCFAQLEHIETHYIQARALASKTRDVSGWWEDTITCFQNSQQLSLIIPWTLLQQEAIGKVKKRLKDELHSAKRILEEAYKPDETMIKLDLARIGETQFLLVWSSDSLRRARYWFSSHRDYHSKL